MHYTLTILAIMFAGPILDVRDWMQHWGYRVYETPLNWNLNNVTTWGDTGKGVVASLGWFDSWGKSQTNRLGGSIAALGLSHVFGFEDFRDQADYGTEFAMASLPGDWTDEGLKSLGAAWGSDGNTSTYIGQGRSIHLDGTVGGWNYIFNFMVDKAKRGIPDDVDITFDILYRKEGFQANVDFITRRYSETTGGSEAVSGINSDSFTMESGSGLGWVRTTITAPSNTSSIAKIGFQLRTGGAGQGFSNIAQNGDRLEILGILWFISETQNGQKVLAPSTGFGRVWFQDDGRSAQEFADDLNTATLSAVLARVAQIRGNGITPSTQPFNTMDVFLGVNPEAGDSNSSIPNFIAGIEALESMVETRLDGGGYTHPHFIYRAMPRVDISTVDQLPRVTLQETALFNHCRTNGHGFISWLGWSGYAYLDELTGDDPFGVAYGTIAYETGNLHLANVASNNRMWVMDLDHTDEANIVTVLTFTGGDIFRDPRNRVRPGP